jgi:hypothetical protein
MRTISLSCFLVLLFCYRATAQSVTEYTPEQALSILDQQIRIAFKFPLDGGPLTTDPPQWLTLTHVGLEIPVDEQLEMQNAINLLAVSCPPANDALGTFASSHRLDHVYELILTHTALRRPEIKIEGIAEAKAATINPDGTPTEKYQTYMRYEQEYDEKSKQITRAESDDEKLELGQEQDKILEAWTLSGHKKEIGEYLDKINADAAISDASGITWRLDMLAGYRRLMSGPFGGQRFSTIRPKSSLVPGVKSWQGNAGWTSWKFSKNESWKGSRETYDAKTRSYKISGGGWFWRSSGNYTKSESEKSEKRVEKVSNLEISFDLRRAVIDRPWLDQRLLFEPGFWTWLKPEGVSSDAPIPLVSKGDKAGSPIDNKDAAYATYKIPIPIVPSEVIVARNLKLKATVSKSDYSMLETASKSNWSGGGSGGFLFWRVGASASGSDESILKKIDDLGDKVSFELSTPGPVAIGFISNVVPQLPSPRTGALWPKNAWFPPGQSPMGIDPDNKISEPRAVIPTATLTNEGD